MDPKDESYGFKPPKRVEIAGRVIGEKPVLIAGPCSLRDREHALETAGFLKDNGVGFFRGSIFKPRTSPDSFQGLGAEGLPILEEVKNSLGMAIVTEVLDVTLVEEVAPYVDMFQVGSRSMQNFQLLRALAKVDKPVLLKRGMAAKVEEWLQAARYLTEGGNENVILCERGIRSFDDYSRFTLDLNVIPHLRQTTEFPILADPSHGTGVKELVIPMSAAALACGANGLLIEVDPEPEQATSDGFQALDFDGFRELLKAVQQYF